MRSLAPWFAQWCARPHAVERVADLASKLRKVMYSTPDNEQSVQNAFESLLVGASIPYRRELDAIVYSSKRYIPDFTLPGSEIAIEIKLCSRAGREKEL